MIRTVVACLLLAAPCISAATCLSYICSGVVTNISVTETAAYIRLSSGVAGLSNCTPYGGDYFTLPKTNPNYSSYYALLLMAYQTKDQVSLRPVDGSSNCTLSYVALP